MLEITPISVAVTKIAGARKTGQLLRWLRQTSSGLVLLAVLVGAGAGVGAIVFRELIIWFTRILTGYADYSGAGRVPNPHIRSVGFYFVILVPVIGGLIYGPIVQRFAKEARGHGVPEVMLAVADKGGRIKPAVAVVKSIASAMCIGSGGSVGREGPIVQIGSALGSTMAQSLRISEDRTRLLVACGAAGGISATFNAPIAGVFFAMELILRNFATESFGAVVLASVTASVIGRGAFGNHPFLSLPAFTLVSPIELGFYAILGLVTAVVGVGFTKVLYAMEDFADWAWRWSEAFRPAVGGILLGLLLLACPEMYGVGYPVLEKAVDQHYVAWFLLVLLCSKVVATSLTISIGGSGGVFAPSLFMGAMVGAAFGVGVHDVFPSITAPAGAYGLVAMGGVFAAAARAPITAVLIVFELTDDYQIVLPLMVTIVIATALSSWMSRDTIYTLKLRRRGIDINHKAPVRLMDLVSVADAMEPLPVAVNASEPVSELIRRMSDEHVDAIPVLDYDGRYFGIVTPRDVEEVAKANRLDAVAAEMVRYVDPLSEEQTLTTALELLVGNDTSGLPVLSSEGTELVGWLTHRDVLRAYNAHLHSAKL